ncbi:MAG: hypothetical protein HQL50_01015 [Magnetococcales bacterium]|nr:hypothetical protein [Magnetococcales bacterium]
MRAEAPVSVRVGLIFLLPIIGLAIYLDGLRQESERLRLPVEMRRSDPISQTLTPSKIPRFSRLGKVRYYSTDTLYEYINGHAEHYISAGFKALAVSEYRIESNANGADGEVEQPDLVVDLFDMGKPLHAFGILMDEGGGSLKAVDVGDMGFGGERNLAFFQSRFFFKVTGFRDNLDLISIGEFLADLVPKGSDDKEISLRFPDLGVVQSTKYIKEDFHGIDFMDSVLERSYHVADGGVVTAFIMLSSDQEIARVVESLRAFHDAEQISYGERRLGSLGLTRVDDPFEGVWHYHHAQGRLFGLFGVLPEALIPKLQQFLSSSDVAVSSSQQANNGTHEQDENNNPIQPEETSPQEENGSQPY